MTDPPPRTMLGAIIRRQREMAELSMRQLSATAGISNPYLSQIERGLRRPSEQVLSAIADSLETTADALYSAAGYVPGPPETGADLVAAIDAATELTPSQRRALGEVYRSFVDANAVRRSRAGRAGPGGADVHGDPDGRGDPDGQRESDSQAVRDGR